MLSITKKFEFCYGHYLPGYKGKCQNQHGHNSILEVEIEEGFDSGIEKYPGMVLDFSELKKIVNKEIIEQLDHRNLNDILFNPPTAENIVEWIVIRLKNLFGQYLLRVRIYETSDSYVEWRRE